MPAETNHLFDSKFSISPDVMFQEISGETVLLDLVSESYFGLDQTATRIWQLLRDANTPSRIHQIMAAEFEVDPAQLKTDLVGHLQELLDAGLIAIVDNGEN